MTECRWRDLAGVSYSLAGLANTRSESSTGIITCAGVAHDEERLGHPPTDEGSDPSTSIILCEEVIMPKVIDLGWCIGKLDRGVHRLTIVSPSYSAEPYAPTESVVVRGEAALLVLRDALNEAYP